MDRALNVIIAMQFAWIGLASEITFIDSLLHEGDACTLADGVTRGTCRRDTSCLYLKTVSQDEWKTCAFVGNSAIVCCPDKTPIALQDVPGRFKYKSDEMCASFRDTPVTTNHILNGTEAQIEDFPYLGALALQESHEPKYGCGASLISDRFLLTAAHCVVGKKIVHVRLGTLSLEDNTVGEEPVIIGIEEPKYIHPNYTKVNRRMLRNDIALLKLNRTVVEEFLIPACLYTEQSDPLPGVPLSIAGWGVTDANDGDMSPILLKAQVSTYERDKCDSDMKNDSNPFARVGLVSGQLCTLSRKEGELMNDTCPGDSGGPLELSVGRRNYIVGITSTGMPCGTNFPGIYTRVSQYIRWIESIIFP
ncbi:serine protease Hayan-like [Aedes albopictus]|uniref:Peptidase S1 domain-containing protein n=1 Tax=Aedes albopictus TaxID=7160 RepID=A0ABM1ZAB0_AEDAL